MDRERIYETPIPTVENPAQTPARFLEPQFDQERQGHAGQPPPRRPQTPHAGLILMPAVPPQRLRFPRAARIKQGCDFARARQEGQRCICGCLIANWRVLPDGTSTRLGLVVSRKVGSSVVRSRARRLLRESFRLHQYKLARSVDLVLVARHSIAQLGLGGVEKDFLTTMKRAGLLRVEPIAPPAQPAGFAESGQTQPRRDGGSAEK